MVYTIFTDSVIVAISAIYAYAFSGRSTATCTGSRPSVRPWLRRWAGSGTAASASAANMDNAGAMGYGRSSVLKEPA